jgi:hypothetical protein
MIPPQKKHSGKIYNVYPFFKKDITKNKQTEVQQIKDSTLIVHTISMPKCLTKKNSSSPNNPLRTNPP